VGEYLLRWQPTAKTLLLVGPSGGYCLQPFLFERFERVVCLEPDPVARWVFRRKLKEAPLERRPLLEFIAEDNLVRYPERLPKLARSLGDCAVLFSNVLGQVRGLLGIDDESPELERVRVAVRETIAGRAFASFHDRVSGPLRPNFTQPYCSEHRLTDDELKNCLFKHSGWLGKSAEEVELLDHLSAGFFSAELPHAYFTWPLEPGRYHVIEAVSQS
jgi:hypothetical protein